MLRNLAKKLFLYQYGFIIVINNKNIKIAKYKNYFYLKYLILLFSGTQFFLIYREILQ